MHALASTLCLSKGSIKVLGCHTGAHTRHEILTNKPLQNHKKSKSIGKVYIVSYYVVMREPIFTANNDINTGIV